MISLGLSILVSATPAFAQQTGAPLQGKVEHQDATDVKKPVIQQPVKTFSTTPYEQRPIKTFQQPTTRVPTEADMGQQQRTMAPVAPQKFPTEMIPRRDVAPQAAIMQPRVPSAADLKPVDPNSVTAPTDVWSMQVLPYDQISVRSPDITWGVEATDSKSHHEWDVWISRVMLVIFQDCSRFRCPTIADHMCDVNIRRDGAIVLNITPDGDVTSKLFRNAVMRLQGQQVIEFPMDSRQNKIEFRLRLHYGKPQPLSSIYRDAFGQPEARYPLEKSYW